MPSASPREILQAASLFATLDPAESAALATHCQLRQFAHGALLFSEGQSCQGLYIVVSGRIRIFKISPQGREQVLAVEGEGASVAELPVFDGGAYPASASALEPTVALFVSRDGLRALCLEKPEIALKLLQVVGARLRHLVGIIEELSFSTVRHRLIAWLLREAEAEGCPTPRGAVLTMSCSQQELAAQIGTVRELVSRNLTRLQAQGFIEVNAREITLLDRDGLEADLASIA